MGAGVCGISAAIHAARYDCPDGRRIPVTVLSSEAPFGPQRGTATRILEPVAYAWPHSHWDSLAIQGAPLPLERETAIEASLRWLEAWEAVYAEWENLEADFHCSAIDPAVFTPVSNGWIAPIGSTTYRASAILDCLGAGEECLKFDSDDHVSFPFWAQDRILLPALGLPNAITPRVLIAGGGDGAIQDLCRVLTRKTAVDILRELDLPEFVHAEVYHIEYDAGRRCQLSATPEMSSILDELHDGYRALIARLQRDPSWPAIMLALPIRDEFREARDTGALVHVVYPGPRFSRCYAANHFVGLLLDARFGNSILYPNWTVTGAVPFLDGKPPNPASCHGVPIVVWIREVNGQPMTFESNYNIVINRTGVQKSTSSSPLLPESNLLLPFRHPTWRFGAAATAKA